MSIPKKPIKLLQNLFRQMRKLFDATAKALANALLRSWLRVGKRPNLTRAGFALPTAMMVMLVVILLTTALVIRSMDRNRNAILARSEQVIQNSSTPALDRAKAKLTALLADPNLPRGTPPDEKLLEVMQDAKYTFGDETRLKIAFDLNGNQTLDPPSTSNPENDETLNTVWKYPVDTDGNGKFDSLTLYGIYWRNPTRQPAPNQNQYEQRQPLHSRSLPQDTQGVGQVCKAAGQTAATSVENSDWYKQGSTLSKAFYVYAATVPISDVTKIEPAPFPGTKFENNPRTDKAFSGLEYEQDRYRSGLNNNAIWYQNDLIINPGNRLYLNGRVFTNGNLLAGAVPPSGNVKFHQVSSIYSCFYEKENAIIQVGGNVGTGDVTRNDDQQPTTVDLFQGPEQMPIETQQINATTKSTDKSGGQLVANNDNAYEQRIALMRNTALSFCTNCATTTDNTQMLAEVAGVAEYSDPDLQKSFQTALDADTNNDPYQVVKDQIEIYLRNRTRRVPYAEISDPAGTDATAPYDAAGAGVDSSVFSGSTIGGIEPPAEWREPLNGNTFTNTSPSVNLVSANLPQTNPDTISTNNPIENELGDRVSVGNNLPALWKDSTGKYVGQNLEKQQYTDNTQWTDGGGTRYRISQVQPLENLGAANRGGYWEQAAASPPTPPSSDPNASGTTGGGGLRIVTGAGIYVDGNTSDGAFYPRDAVNPEPDKSSFLPQPNWDTRFVDPSNTDPNKIHPDDLIFAGQPPLVVWPDLMPMTGGAGDSTSGRDSNGDGVRDNLQKGDLLMRATAVYHYTNAQRDTDDKTKAITPIACVSSYYDPTTAQTARNEQQLPDVSGGIDTNGDGVIDQEFGGASPGRRANGKSNNGVVYNYPGFQRRARYNAELQQQARLVFPNGRIVNQPLRDALTRTPGTTFTFAQRSAIDSAICALAILKKEVPRSTVIPDGAIREAAFLDGREIKAIDKLTPKDPNYDINQNYDLPLEERQPLEVRVTDINLRLLASTQHNTYDVNGDGQAEQEYLLPLSGIVYATRDDALADASNPDATLSSTDFRLDPTRRPNGIRLINGMRLARGTGNNYNNTKEEKGLILATNLPAYVKGTFNPHTPSEKTEATDPSFNGPELEEFTAALQANWSNFYERGDGGGNGVPETRFACRQGQPLCTGNGDQWRPATIIADAVTLQSRNFQDGYRNQGDFDLRNNGGSVLTGRRVNQGFFDNSFVTSANWSSDPTNPVPAPASQVSYLVNGVTPIQRRATAVAYATEICRKLPVSQCTAGSATAAPDWVPDGANTSTTPAAAADVRYARRVAFQKAQALNPDTTPNGYFKYYYDTSGYPQLAAAPTAPTNNALWFVTRDAQGLPSYDGGTTNQQPLIFEPKYPVNYPVAALQNQRQLPDLKWLRGYLAASPSQNLPMPTDLADHIGPIPGGAPTSGSGEDFATRIGVIRNQFFGGAFPANMRFTLPYEKQFLNFSNSETNRTIDLTGGGKMRVFFISGGLDFLKGFENTRMPIQGDEGSVYVFLVSGDINVKQGANLNLGTVLGQTVLPDNVYWIVAGKVSVARNATLKGNVLASGTIILDKNAKIEGRAISTTQTVNLAGGTYSAKIVAPGGNQPRLVPVTQIQSPDGLPQAGSTVWPTTTTSGLTGTDSNYPNLWLQQATSTIYNAAFVVGDSPIRPQETSAGLNNLVRLQENWNPSNVRKDVNIKGSFIQQTRSSVATGSFAPIRGSGTTPTATTTDGLLSIFGYPNNKYWTNNGTPRGTQPYYNTPGRQWGFDVGLLSQSPDLFSQKFTTDIPKLQNFYRQVGRDDPWIQTLLCAKQPPNPDPAQRVGDGATYNKYVVPDKDRPDCRSATGVGAGATY